METPMTDFEELAWASSQFLTGKLSLGIYTFVHLVISFFFFPDKYYLGRRDGYRRSKNASTLGTTAASSRSAC